VKESVNKKGKEGRNMKKIWMVWFVLVVFLVMGACAGMTKSGEKIHRARGTVDAYEPGKMLKLSDKMEIEGFGDEGDTVVVAAPKPGEYTFALTPATDVKGTITKNVRVLVRYTESGGAKTAVSIEKVWGK
jgi:hypothetical protein